MNPDDQAVLRAEERRISALRLQMLDLHPFWGYLLAHLRVLPAPALPAFAATDCWRHVWYNPRRTQHLSMGQLGFVLAHELGHHLLASAERRRGRNPHRWNCATDFAVNRIVAAIEHPTRRGVRQYESPDGQYPELGDVRILLDERWDGMIAEAIYEYLTEPDLPAPDSVVVELDEPSSSGGGSHHVRLPNLTDHGGGLDLHLPERLTPEQRRGIRERIDGALVHARASRQPGDVPGEEFRGLDADRPARVPWQRQLRRYAGSATTRDEFARHRPDRRFVDFDIAVPGRLSEGLGTLVVALDTSASMSDELLASVGGELRALARAVQEARLIVADAKVQQVVTDLELEGFLAGGRVQGGGGTDHRPVFAWLEEHRVVPDLFIGITDLESRFPKKAPRFPVLWLTPSRHAEAPWGRVVELVE